MLHVISSDIDNNETWDFVFRFPPWLFQWRRAGLGSVTRQRQWCLMIPLSHSVPKPSSKNCVSWISQKWQMKWWDIRYVYPSRFAIISLLPYSQPSDIVYFSNRNNLPWLICQVSDKTAASSLNVSAGLEDIIQKIEDIVKMINSSDIDNLPKFMQLEVWNKASSSFVKSLTDPNMISVWVKNSGHPGF